MTARQMCGMRRRKPWQESLFVKSLWAAALGGVVVIGVSAAQAAPQGRGGPTPGSVPDWFRDGGPTARADVPAAPVAPAGPAAEAPPAAAPADAVAPAPAAAPDAGGPAAGPAAVGPDERNRPAYPRVPVPGTFAPMGAYGGGSSGFGPYDYPANQVNSYVVAAVRASTARAILNRTQRELDASIREADRRFETSAEMRQSVAAERDAYNALNEARRKALQSLVGDEHYQRVAALRQEIHDRIQDGRANRTATQEEVVAMAKLKMQYGTDLRAMEADALNAEPGVKEAQDRLVAAGSRVAALRERHSDDLRVSPDVVAARRNYEDAKIANIAAQSYLHNAAIAGETALDAYYYARTPFRGYYPGYYDNYNYGFGGYPYARY